MAEVSSSQIAASPAASQAVQAPPGFVDDGTDAKEKALDASGEGSPPHGAVVLPVSDLAEPAVSLENEDEVSPSRRTVREGLTKRLRNFHQVFVQRPSIAVPHVRTNFTSAEVLELMKWLWQGYCKALADRPWAFLLFYALLAVIVIPAMWQPIVVATDLDVFRQVDGDAARTQSRFLQAQGSMRLVKNATALDDRTTYKVEIIYESKDDSSVFSEAAQSDIKNFELSFRKLGGWSRLCGMSDPRARYRCSPGESLGNYVWPRRLDDFVAPQGFFRLEFDGSSEERLPMSAILTYLREALVGPHNPWSFLPLDYSSPDVGSRLVRSVFTFTEPSLDDNKFRQEYQDFISKELYPALAQAAEASRSQVSPDAWSPPLSIRVYFRGDGLDEYQVQQAVYRDLKLAIGPFILSIFVTWFQFRSLFLSIAGTLIISLTALFTYVIVHKATVSVAGFLCLFLIFGLGFGSLFRSQDLWRRSRLEAKSIPERIAALHQAATFEMLPVVSTACCFYIFVSSLMPPLREFGLLMGTGMILVCFVSLAVFVPVLILHELWMRPALQRRLRRPIFVLLEPLQMRLPWKAIAERVVKNAKKGKIIFRGTALVVLITLIALLTVAVQRGNPGVLQVFPPENQMEAGRALYKQFLPLVQTKAASPLQIKMCEPGRFADDPTCVLHWCDVQKGVGSDDISQAPRCTCQAVADSSKSTSCSQVSLQFALSGANIPKLPTADLLTGAKAFAGSYWSEASSVQVSSVPSSRRLPSVVLEDWTSGATNVQPFVALPNLTLSFPSPQLSLPGCTESVYCYCGSSACSAPTGFTANQFTTLSVPLSQNISSLTARPSEASYQVIAVFGIKAYDPTNSDQPWEFDKSFDPVSPWSQRAMLRVCSDVTSNLNVISVDCWIQDFRDWLIASGRIFPVERFLDFQTVLKEFLQFEPAAAKDMWRDEDGNLTATMFTFQVKAAPTTKVALQDRQNWLDYVANLNENAASSAGSSWVTSQAWVDAEAFDESMESAWKVAVTVIGVTLVTGLIYTLDFEIVGLMIVITFAVCIWIGFFFICICGWAFGPWELTIITVFFSFHIEPVFFIGHEFVRPGMPLLGRKQCENHLSSAPAITDSVTALPGSPSSGPARPATDLDEVGQLATADQQCSHPRDDTISEVSSVHRQAEEDIEATLTRALRIIASTIIVGGVKLFLCGILLLPCKLRFFARLGAIAVLMPIVSIPSLLIIFPAVLLYTGRTRREPDIFPISRAIKAWASYFWS